MSRFLSLCGGNTRKMKLAILFQMTFVGMPTVFYGDEQGIMGILEDEYRHPMIWNRQENELSAFYQRAIALRKKYAALCSGAFRCAEAKDRLYHYIRTSQHGSLHILINAGEKPLQIMPPSSEIIWQEGLKRDILSPYGFAVYST